MVAKSIVDSPFPNSSRNCCVFVYNAFRPAVYSAYIGALALVTYVSGRQPSW